MVAGFIKTPEPIILPIIRYGRPQADGFFQLRLIHSLNYAGTEDMKQLIQSTIVFNGIKEAVLLTLPV